MGPLARRATHLGAWLAGTLIIRVLALSKVHGELPYGVQVKETVPICRQWDPGDVQSKITGPGHPCRM